METDPRLRVSAFGQVFCLLASVDEGQRTVNCLLLLFSCLPWAWFIFFRKRYFFWKKDGWLPDTKFEFCYAQCGYNKTKTLCLGSTKMCLVITKTSWMGNWAVRKKESDCTFVLLAIRAHCWFNMGRAFPKEEGAWEDKCRACQVWAMSTASRLYPL